MKVHVLIVGLSEQKYETVMDLVSPRKPRELPYDELVEVLIQHFGGTHNKMVERAKFRELRRTGQESVNDFVVKLKNTARNCQFGAMLEENLLEQFRIGVNSKPIRDRIALMPIDDQQRWKSVLDVAAQVELDENLDSVSNPSASNQVQQIKQHRKKRPKSYGKGYSAGRVSQPDVPAAGRSQSEAVCYRCSKSGHLASSQDCPARTKQCRTCQKVGH